MQHNNLQRRDKGRRGALRSLMFAVHVCGHHHVWLCLDHSRINICTDKLTTWTRCKKKRSLAWIIIVFLELWTIQCQWHQHRSQQWKQIEQEYRDSNYSNQNQRAMESHQRISSRNSRKNVWHTKFMIRLAETFTGTPSSVSWINKPEPTSLTDSASRLYFSGHNHCSHRRTGGIELRCTKKPANVIWYSADKAESRMAMPPFWNNVPSKKFYIWTDISKKARIPLWWITYEKRHSHTVKHQDKEKFEEIRGMWS